MRWTLHSAGPFAGDRVADLLIVGDGLAKLHHLCDVPIDSVVEHTCHLDRAVGLDAQILLHDRCVLVDIDSVGSVQVLKIKKRKGRSTDGL
jgi:hypothetical protein